MDANIALKDIEAAISNIEGDLIGVNYDDFVTDRKTLQSVERNFEVISEAIRRIPESVKTKERGIQWTAFAGVGNLIRHEEHKIHPRMVWGTCKKELGPLKAAIKRIRKDPDLRTE